MTTHTLKYWENRVKELSFRIQAFINGRYCDAQSGQTFECINPADGSILTRVCSGDMADVNLAVKAARQAFEKGSWAHTTPQHRKKVLLRFAELIEQHAQEIALLETLNMGKPISQSFLTPCSTGPFPPDLVTAPNHIRWFAEAVDKIYDEIGPSGPDVLSLIKREPIGVVAAVVPWNFPLLMACWKIGPALAAGNSVILKPAEQSPLSAIKLAELATQAGLPDGVLNVIPGLGHTAGAALGLHNDVDCIAFTGSGEVGKYFLAYSAKSNMKKVWLECGGKGPNIIMADCANLDKAIEATAYGAFYNQGEVCAAAPRLLIEEPIKNVVMDKLLSYVEQFRPDNPLDPNSRSGAIVTKQQMDHVLNYIHIGEQEGANIYAGGRQIHKKSGGYYVEPTIFDPVAPDTRIAKEEIFGPVLSVLDINGIDQAIEIANNTIYGLTASVWTSDLNKAHQFSCEIKAGTVWVNCYEASDVTSPFGGFKQSGIGRDRSLHAFDKYTELKSTWFNFE